MPIVLKSASVIDDDDVVVDVDDDDDDDVVVVVVVAVVACDSLFDEGLLAARLASVGMNGCNSLIN